MRTVHLLIISLFSCVVSGYSSFGTESFRKTMTAAYNNVSVQVVVDKPALDELDVLVVFHGTVLYDRNNIRAAGNTLDRFKSILDRNDMMIVSVAYPGENMLMGDNIIYAEAALLWVKHLAGKELGISVKKIFLAGHSQGGYLVTRLNTMHQTAGVIANAPGPLNLVYRCGLEEKGIIPSGFFCTSIRNQHGSTGENPEAYMTRSLLNFTGGYKSDILFVQGLSDSAIHMYSWKKFKDQVSGCTDCKERLFTEIEGAEHSAMFVNSVGISAFNDFISNK